MTTTQLPTYKPKDFATDQDVRWCPGCGDYAVLKAVQKALAGQGIRREDYVFVSGIGCAARFPYYMETYGMHSIHGRAPAFATGVKLANPDLQVWLVSGDGDLLSIGGNHTMHAMRRNVDINIILLNNRVYGLTKGQYSPTSEFGKVTKSTPMGSVDYPINPLNMAVAAGATFIARCLDLDVPMLVGLMERAAAHKGLAFIEVLQDCNIFNHAAWFHASQKDQRADNTVALEHGKPVIFGANRDKGIRPFKGRLHVVELGHGIEEEELLLHDETERGKAYLLSQMAPPDFPEPLGVIYNSEDRRTYESLVHDQLREAEERRGKGDLNKLLRDTDTWVVERESEDHVEVGGYE
jgi:2-oxoglutarate ferredoxin oxidoreductase subunit beta